MSLTDEQIAEIKARLGKTTPGPWGWFGNTDVHTIYLATKGFGRLTVMSFRRWGLQNAQPMFATHRTWKPDPKSGDDFGTCGRMEQAARLARYEVAPDAPDHTHSSVYRRDLDGIKNPDAEFIAAARQDVPALLAEVERLKAERQRAIDALNEPGRDAVATTGDLEDGINMDAACRSYEQPETVQRQEINRLKDGMVALIRAWRAHDDEPAFYDRCADEIENLLNGGAWC